MKFRKKPVIIEAFKYDGDLKDRNGLFYVPFWAQEAYKKGIMYYGAETCDLPPCELYIETLEGTHHVSVGDYVIQGVNGELYPCKPDIFEKTYEMVADEDNCCVLGGQSTFGFGDAIRYLKKGLKVARKGWNGKKQYIQLAAGISYKTADGEIVNCEHDAIGNKAIAFVGTSGVQMGWLASQADMLADDWIFTE
jgi:hypothetical protein